MFFYNSLQRSVPQGHTKCTDISLAFLQESCSTKGKHDPLRSPMWLADLIQDFPPGAVSTQQPQGAGKPLSHRQLCGPSKEHQIECLET